MYYMNKSFTLIEVLVVIVVIGILSAFILVGTSSISTSANITKGQVFLNSLDSSLLIARVAYWKLDVNDVPAANRTPDAWGTNTGVITGTTLQSSGCVSGKCVSFNGSSDFISCGADDSLNISGPITISVWIKPMGTTGQEGIIGTPNFSSAYGLYIRHSPGQDVGFQFDNGSGNRYYLMAGTLNYGSWNYIVGTWDGSNMKIYLNNIQYSGSTATANTRNFQEFRIGYTGSIAAPVYFNGLIDEVRIYNQAMPSSQINQSYFTGLNKLLINSSIYVEEFDQRMSELSGSLADN
jgi:prepilin-type N-terminal cleavage/methylation domain-containing protein